MTAGIRRTIKEVKQLVESKGGELLSTEYNNSRTPLKIKCATNHEWITNCHNLVTGRWCPLCANKLKLGYNIEFIKNFAIEKGGQCLSSEYISNNHLMDWQCQCGYIWKSRWRQIYNTKTWCPQCARGLHERLCRNYFEAIFDKKFPMAKPEWLINENGNLLELDGFCENFGIDELGNNYGLAFEHNGKQHYEDIKFYDGHEGFIKVQKHDVIKNKLCIDHNVKLITIPELVEIIKIEDLPNFIKEQLIKLDIIITDKFYTTDIKDLCLYSSKLDDLKKIAEERGGRLLSANYINANEKLEWQCAKGHIWSAKSRTVKFGSWCPACANCCLARHTVEDAHIAAKSHNGKCLSTEYSYHTKLEWECEFGHQWKQKLTKIINDHSWCPVCAVNARRGPHKKSKSPTT